MLTWEIFIVVLTYFFLYIYITDHAFIFKCIIIHVFGSTTRFFNKFVPLALNVLKKSIGINKTFFRIYLTVSIGFKMWLDDKFLYNIKSKPNCKKTELNDGNKLFKISETVVERYENYWPKGIVTILDIIIQRIQMYWQRFLLEENSYSVTIKLTLKK